MSCGWGVSAPLIIGCVRTSSHKTDTEHNQKKNGGILSAPAAPTGAWLSDDCARLLAAEGANGAANPPTTRTALMPFEHLLIVGALPLAIIGCNRSSRSAPADTLAL